MNLRFLSLARTAGLLLAFVLLCAQPWLAHAETPDSLLPPQKVVEDTSNRVREALRRNNYRVDFAEATRIVRDILEPRVDFNQAALLIVGKHWRTATPAQRERFKSEFRTLLIRTYTTAFHEYKDWNIRHLPLQMAPGEKKALVRTEILQPDAKPVAVNYRMRYAEGEWKAYDVMIEGISLVQNYRTTFSGDIERTGSLDGVIQELATRNAAASKEPLGKTSAPVIED
jgi:phospholipid transport system substrate-binding protein